MTRVLTVQTVRFHDPHDALRASVESIGHAVAVARHAGMAGEVVVALGDATPDELSPGTIHELTTLAQHFDVSFHYVGFGRNTGSAAGQNHLAEMFPATWQFMTNPDVIFAGGCVRDMWARTLDATIGQLEARQLPLELAKSYDVDSGDTSWASGACSMVRGELWREIGGYDADTFFLYGDDVDASWRIRRHGYRVVHVPSARVFHPKSLSLAGDDVARTELHYSALAGYLMARKWGTSADRERAEANISGDDYVEVRREIAERAEGGTLPSPLSGASTVARFAPDGTFGERRF